MNGPPIHVLAEGVGWSLSIVKYPSGPCLELVDTEENRLAYSERLEDINKKAQSMKREGYGG
jgi:hypothetical protein